MQGQGYWVLANWMLFDETGDDRYRDLALRCTEQMQTQQRSDGTWVYPLAAWKGKVATVEGIWAAIGMLETFRRTQDEELLEGILRWHRYLLDAVGFQHVGEGLAINYFQDGGELVPNNSTDVMRYLAELAQATSDSSILEPCAGLVAFLKQAQKSSGEFPYVLNQQSGGKGRPHFQCFQYNAFQCFGLLRYHELTGDDSVITIIKKLLGFLKNGVAEDGHALFQCGNRYRAITYHATAVGAAFAKAGQLGLGNNTRFADHVFEYVLGLQRQDGGFLHSQRDYRILTDRRSYPRYLAMILFHLLLYSQTIEEPLSSEELPRAFANYSNYSPSAVADLKN